MLIDVKATAQLLSSRNDILILTHANPDGDTLGSGFALMRALLSLGKRVRLENNDTIPAKYDFLSAGLEVQDFEPQLIMSVDVADPKLFGTQVQEKYGDRVELCIDHHGSNKLYAEKTLLVAEASSNAEVVYEVIKELGVEITSSIADGIYTGVSTDTGGFRYGNTTPESLNVAAEMMKAGADYKKINIVMFETKSASYFELERLGLEGLTFHYDGKVALMSLTQEMFNKSGHSSQECDALCAIPRQIEGVKVGATIKEKEDGRYKISVRTNEPYDASEICVALGGGGHKGAAGCELKTCLEDVKIALLVQIRKALENNGDL